MSDPSLPFVAETSRKRDQQNSHRREWRLGHRKVVALLRQENSWTDKAATRRVPSIGICLPPNANMRMLSTTWASCTCWEKAPSPTSIKVCVGCPAQRSKGTLQRCGFPNLILSVLLAAGMALPWRRASRN